MAECPYAHTHTHRDTHRHTHRDTHRHTHTHTHTHTHRGFPGGSVVKSPPANPGDRSWIPGSGRSPGGGHSNPFQYSCLGNSNNRRAWQATVHRVTKELGTTQ